MEYEIQLSFDSFVYNYILPSVTNLIDILLSGWYDNSLLCYEVCKFFVWKHLQFYFIPFRNKCYSNLICKFVHSNVVIKCYYYGLKRIITESGNNFRMSARFAKRWYIIKQTTKLARIPTDNLKSQNIQCYTGVYLQIYRLSHGDGSLEATTTYIRASLIIRSPLLTLFYSNFKNHSTQKVKINLKNNTHFNSFNAQINLKIKSNFYSSILFLF